MTASVLYSEQTKPDKTADISPLSQVELLNIKMDYHQQYTGYTAYHHPYGPYSAYGTDSATNHLKVGTEQTVALYDHTLKKRQNELTLFPLFKLRISG